MLETYEALPHEQLVRVCYNLETTIQLKDDEIERINKHTDHIIGMYYEIEAKLAQRNGELVSCQAGLKEVQDALSQWRRELVCSSLSTDSSRNHPSSTPDISSGTGSSEGDYRMSLQRDADMEESSEASGAKGDDYAIKQDSKNERRHSSRKSNNLDLLGKNMHPILHRRQRNDNNSNSSCHDPEIHLYRADVKSPHRPDAAEHIQNTKRHHHLRPQLLSKPLFHSVNGPLRVVCDDRQVSPHGNTLSRSMALEATDRTYEEADAGLQMMFNQKDHNMSAEGASLIARKSEIGYNKRYGADLYEHNNDIVTDVKGVKNVVNGNDRLSPALLVASLGRIDNNNTTILPRPKGESGCFEDNDPTVKKSMICDRIDSENYQLGVEDFVHDIIESLIRRVCFAERNE